MARVYSNYWWVYLVRGIFAILFGVTTLVLPVMAFATLVILFGTFMIADGLFSIMFSMRRGKPVRNRPWLLFMGITGVLAGALMLFNPFISAITLACLFAFWSFFAGIMEMIRAVQVRKEKRKEIWYVLSGILSILVAVLLLIDPLSGAMTLTLVFGIYAMLIGLSLVSLAFKLKRQPGEYRERSVKTRRKLASSST